MSKENCWEYMKCGREPGGERELDMGVCPAATEEKIDGVHHGKNGGRACWVLAGTFCGGATQGSYTDKVSNCAKCDFYKKVFKEELSNYKFPSDIIKMMK